MLKKEGETRHYDLLNKPVEIKVSNNTFKENTNIVINKKPAKLPYTGAIGSIIIISIGIALVSSGIILSRRK